MGPALFRYGQVVDNRYRIEGRLGQGGMGEVWHAVDLKLQVEVALKSLLGARGQRTGAEELLRREVRAARQVISPHVCRIFDLVVVDGQELVSMEYIDGQTLTERLAMGGLELRTAADIAAQFLVGLEAIHRVGLVHSDVKPDNVMITRAWRVVVMDLGIAKPPQRQGMVAGTPAYMAPEQVRGQLEVRSDVFAAGMVLAELIDATETERRTPTERLRSGIREMPPRLPPSPWRDVLLRAVDADPARRFSSAQALARALEEVTLRVEGEEDRSPYPGLAAFDTAAAEYFFGREAEVEAVARKLGRFQMQAVIGPSGTGKSSFLRAGLIPALGDDWGWLICQPGASPMEALSRALDAELAEETPVTEPFGEPEGVIAGLRRWRAHHGRALLVVDQFEELFTMHAEETQRQFSELLARAAVEADVRILLSLRDDFLYACQAQPALAPIFAGLTPIATLGGEALRRALVQPALLCGYRFEDEALVEEMVAEVTEERGALPLLAFAAARLWEHRDRDRGLLTREAYEAVGGVGGALAQHAEETLQEIGVGRLAMVRELFRNLVTADGTRAVRRVDDLLSLFGAEATAGEQVLRALIGARLLTVFDTAPADGEPHDGEAGEQRVEIIHESLLTAWPRLVRWRTQDADGAQLREQLRQAAQLWQARSRPADLLWTGDSYREFQVWRRRYPGALTAAEEDYARAMGAHAKQRQQRRRLAVGAAFAILLVILGVVGLSRQEAVAARRQALAEADRAEAGKLVVLGRLEIGEDPRKSCPSTALAYAIAALERHDNLSTRMFALEALWRGPAGFLVSPHHYRVRPFGPGGQWLAEVVPGEVRFWPRDGLPPSTLPLRLARFGGRTYVHATPDPDVLQVGVHDGRVAELWSIREGRLRQSFEKDSDCVFVQASDAGTVVCLAESDGLTEVRELPLHGGEARVLGHLELAVGDGAAVGGRVLLTVRGQTVQRYDLDRLDLGPRVVGEHEAAISMIRLDPSARTAVSTDRSGEIRVWSLAPPHGKGGLLASYPGPPGLGDLSVDPQHRTLAAASQADGTVWLRYLEGPPDAEPLVLHRKSVKQAVYTSVDPRGEWVTTTGVPDGMTLWPLRRRHPFVLSRTLGIVWDIAFFPSGDAVAVAAQDGTVRIFPLDPTAGVESRVLFRIPRGYVTSVAVDPRGRWLLAGGPGGPWRIPLDGGEPDALPGFKTRVWPVAFSPDGRFAASAGGFEDVAERVIRIWDVDTAEVVQVLGPPEPGTPASGEISKLHYSPDGRRLISSGFFGALLWSLEDGTSEVLGDGVVTVFTRDGRSLFKSWGDWKENGAAAIQDLETGTLKELTTHGNALAIALSSDEKIVVTGGHDGILRVGSVDGSEPHLLMGHVGLAVVGISPDDRWIVSGGMADGTLRVWPMPDLSRPPLHTLPRDELLAKLKSLTNFRIVGDETVPDGYRVNFEAFAGWPKDSEWP